MFWSTVRWAVVALAMGIAIGLAPAGAGPARDWGSALNGGDPAELTLMTFNIRYATARDGPNAWEHRRELLARVVREADPDVIGLQEALRSQLDDLRGLLPGYAHSGVGRDDGKDRGEHCTIMFRADRFAIASGGADAGTFWLSDTPEVPGSKSWGNTITRICTWVRLEPVDAEGGGGAFYVYNVHLDHQSQPSRERAVELIGQRIAAREHAGDPVVLMGDFNAGERNAAILAIKGAIKETAFAGEGPRFICAFRAANPDERDVGTYHAFKGTRTGEMIDYIFIPAGSEVRTAAIIRTHDDGLYPSDHFPVVATVRLGGVGAAGSEPKLAPGTE